MVGIGSAYFGGRVDLWLQRMVGAWMAFPGLLLLMSIMSLVGPGAWNITLVLGMAFGIQNSRIVRGVALSIKEYTYIEGARAAGAGHARITATHILPNVLPTIIMVATTGLSTVILTEASLSFLGLGVPPPYPTWGGMLSSPAWTTCTRRPGWPSGQRWRCPWPCSGSTCWATRSATSSTPASRAAAETPARQRRTGARKDRSGWDCSTARWRW